MLERKRYLCHFNLALLQGCRINLRCDSFNVASSAASLVWISRNLSMIYCGGFCSVTVFPNVVLCVCRPLPFLYNEVVVVDVAIREGYHKYVSRRINSLRCAVISGRLNPGIC